MTHRVLVVDDDAAMRIVLERTLTQEGYEVSVAANGVEALRLLERSAFDLVITDLVMPELEGLELIRQIRKLAVTPSIIAMSGGGRGSAASYLELAKLLGASAILAKPFTPKQLSEAIDVVSPV